MNSLDFIETEFDYLRIFVFKSGTSPLLYDICITNLGIYLHPNNSVH